METAASTSKRKEIRVRKMAQKIILSHIENYLGSVLWGVNLIDDNRYYSLPLPTYRDYERLITDIKNNDLFIPEKPEGGRILIGIQNVYFIRKEDGKLYEERRPEDAGKEDVPKVAYLVVNEKALENKSNKRFKCRDINKLLNDVRALGFIKLVEKNKEIESFLIEKGERKEGKDFKNILRDAGYSKEKIDKIIRKNENSGQKFNKMSRDLTIQDIIRKEFFKNRKVFDKKKERLKKMGLAL